MNEAIEQRTGVRVKVNHDDGIEAVIYADEQFPDFCANYEINLGGLKILSATDSSENQSVTVRLFGRPKHSVVITGRVVGNEPNVTVIAFETLDKEQTTTLCKILEYQQAV